MLFERTGGTLGQHNAYLRLLLSASANTTTVLSPMSGTALPPPDPASATGTEVEVRVRQAGGAYSLPGEDTMYFTKDSWVDTHLVFLDPAINPANERRYVPGYILEGLACHGGVAGATLGGVS